MVKVVVNAHGDADDDGGGGSSSGSDGCDVGDDNDGGELNSDNTLKFA